MNKYLVLLFLVIFANLIFFTKFFSNKSCYISCNQSKNDFTLHNFSKTDEVFNCFYKFNDSTLREYKILTINKNENKLRTADSIFSIFSKIKEFEDITIKRIDDNVVFAGIQLNMETGRMIRVNNGLINSKYINKEGLIIIIAHELAHVVSVKCNNGHYCDRHECTNVCNKCLKISSSCIAGEPLADYNSIKYILPYFCSTNTEAYNQIVIKGISQIDSFIRYENGYLAKGYHKDVDCRINILKDSYSGNSMNLCSKQYCFN